MPVGLASLATCWREQKTQMPTPQEIELRAQLARSDERINLLERKLEHAENQHGELLAALKESLPPFMQPNTAVQLDEMPLNKNGKIDRTALAALTKKGAHK